MQTFTNAFDIAVSDDKNEVFVNFSQNIPVLGVDGKVNEVHLSPVANLVMSGKTAYQFLAMLSNLLEETEQ